jgi:hypothetical protein
MVLSGPREGEQVGVELLFVGPGQAVWRAGVDLEFRVLEQLRGHPWLKTTGCPEPQSLEKISVPSVVVIVPMPSPGLD